MRAINIIFIVLSFFFIIIMTAGTAGTRSERSRYYDRMTYSQNIDPYGYDSYDYGDPAYVTSTYVAVGMSMGFFVFAIVFSILNVTLVKTKTSRVLGIIGLSLTVLMTIWGIMALSSPRSMSFDEIGGAWVFYGVIMLTFSIIATVQAFRYHNQKNPPVAFGAGNFQQPYGQPYPPFQQMQNPYQPYQQNFPPYMGPPNQYPPQTPYYPQTPQQPPQPYYPPQPQQPYQPPQQQQNPYAPQDPPVPPQTPPPPVQNPWAPKDPPQE